MSKGFMDYKTYDPAIEGYGSFKQWKQNFHQRMSREDAEEFLKDDDPYTLLGIKRGASKAEIKKAYRAMAQKYHPDINKADNATEMMQKINAAYWAIY